jgi:hypothetical protein
MENKMTRIRTPRDFSLLDGLLKDAAVRLEAGNAYLQIRYEKDSQIMDGEVRLGALLSFTQAALRSWIRKNDPKAAAVASQTAAIALAIKSDANSVIDALIASGKLPESCRIL